MYKQLINKFLYFLRIINVLFFLVFWISVLLAINLFLIGIATFLLNPLGVYDFVINTFFLLFTFIKANQKLTLISVFIILINALIIKFDTQSQFLLDKFFLLVKKKIIYEKIP